uniref:Saposin B-type domain-containing protein n=1 Tax=Panagrolaimus sp. PS1159 TaxID=55785 RepID=A0AC35GD01_9BILA
MNKILILVFVAFIISAIVASPETDDAKRILEAVKDDETNSTTTIDDDTNNSTTAATPLSPDNSMGCKLCMGFVDGLENMIGTEEGNVEQKANKVCDGITMGNELADTNKVCDGITMGNELADSWCKKIADDSLEMIVKAIKKSETPQKICKDVAGMCNA